MPTSKTMFSSQGWWDDGRMVGLAHFEGRMTPGWCLIRNFLIRQAQPMQDDAGSSWPVTRNKETQWKDIAVNTNPWKPEKNDEIRENHGNQWQSMEINGSDRNQWQAKIINDNKWKKTMGAKQGEKDREGKGRGEERTGSWIMRVDGWWQRGLAEQDDDGMMAGWCGPMADDKSWWVMTGHTGWEGLWQDDGRMMRAKGRMIQAYGYMSRMTPGWCILEADNKQLMTFSYKFFRKSTLKCGQEAAHQDDTRMIGRMMTRMI